MIASLISESAITIEAVRYNNLDQYTTHAMEVRSISSYILESTLQLLNLELADYQLFIKKWKTGKRHLGGSQLVSLARLCFLPYLRRFGFPVG